MRATDVRRNRANLVTDVLIAATVVSCLAEWAWHVLRHKPLLWPVDAP